MNYAMAFLFYALLQVVFVYICPIFAGTYMANFLLVLFASLYGYSLVFCIFNLVPLYPLDGFRIIDAVNTRRGKIYYFLRDKGQMVLLVLILIHFMSDRILYLGYVDVLGYFMYVAENILSKPITWAWDWLLRLVVY